MQANITFRGMESTESLKSHVTERVEHIEKFLDRPVEAHVVLSLERYLHQADITIHAGPYLLRGKVKTEDMYKSIDGAIDKIERQLKRYKEKVRSAKLRGRDEDHVRVQHRVIEVAGPEHEESEEWSAGPKVIRSDEYVAKPMTVDEAVMQMDLMNAEFLVYRNADSGAINVVYRRQDGHFGLIEAPPDAAVPLAGKGKSSSARA